jgi:DNA-binding transcriptional ArsR family regulator
MAETRRELEQVYVRDVATFKALADPLRLQILMELATEAKPVKEVASNLQVKSTRLYYHFKILEAAGLIRVADRRMVSGIEESSYEAIGESWQPAPDATAELVKSGIVRAILAMVRAELELALLAQPEVPAGDPKSSVPVLTMTELALTESEVVEVQERIVALTQEFAPQETKDPAKRPYRALFAGYLPPSELRDQKDEPVKKVARTRRERRDQPAERAKKAARRRRAPRAT